LFLAANPIGTDRLALDREARAIHDELERAGYRDRFEFATRWAAEPLDLLRELRKLRPTVVHFSGHGSARKPVASLTAPTRDVIDPEASGGEQEPGLCFQNTRGEPHWVSSDALVRAFGAAGASVKLVVLNACYSDEQAEALLAYVPCVVGMAASIDDDAARSFAIGFYGGLGEGESVGTAYEQGLVAISLMGLHAAHPQLQVRREVDASRLVLAVGETERL
jgi:hypothetical protein